MPHLWPIVWLHTPTTFTSSMGTSPTYTSTTRPAAATVLAAIASSKPIVALACATVAC